eukprot:CAMPEP_0202914194 /NCGR_PEP_ID=MMETSP1392-20130828/62508_1 /ASSEMBLY_ACC=CAM_ASM_000868 /TAXON_ID=225041 /ORGANISM="Chlamydomonas chlamydogama, Strain SAG 11-48b" /LENGTH=102 /DNA_ID=CAMNT_0049605749 /DNA_START=273 /DNA_END=578 /DNA_ORIENTATION=+
MTTPGSLPGLLPLYLEATPPMKMHQGLGEAPQSLERSRADTHSYEAGVEKEERWPPLMRQSRSAACQVSGPETSMWLELSGHVMVSDARVEAGGGGGTDRSQ